MTSLDKSFLILDAVDSTNNYAMGLIHRGEAKHGLACFAIEQTAGKGRRGKQWESQKGENIILSIIVEPGSLPLYKQYLLSAMVALSCFDFLNKYSPAITKIKWPNDLFINDRKAGGILVENVVQGSLWQWAVIGIGINVNQTIFLFADDKGISLKNLTGLTYDVIKLGRELYRDVLEGINKIKCDGTGNLMKQYNEKLYGLREMVKFKKQNIIFNALVTGVSEEGQLITFDAMEKRYNLDEIEWVL